MDFEHRLHEVAFRQEVRLDEENLHLMGPAFEGLQRVELDDAPQLRPLFA